MRIIPQCNKNVKGSANIPDLRISFVDRHNRRDEPAQTTFTWAELGSLLTHFEPARCAAPGVASTLLACIGRNCPHKTRPTDVSAWIPARFEEGAPRVDDAVIDLAAVVLDIDHVVLAEVERLIERLAAEGVAAIIHSSHSHAPPHDCAVRVILPLDRPCPVTDWSRVRRAVIHALEADHLVDRATGNSSRLYFLPSVRDGVEAIARVLDGVPLSLDRVLEVAAEMPAAPAPPPTSAPVPAPARGPSILDEPEHRAHAVRVIARHFPALGSRHRYALAIGGVLCLHSRLDEDAAARLMLDAAVAAGSSDPSGRAQDVRDTYRRAEEGIGCTGIPTLREIVEEADAIVRAISDTAAEERRLASDLRAKAQKRAQKAPAQTISPGDLRRRLKGLRRRKLRSTSYNALVLGALLDRLLAGDALATDTDEIEIGFSDALAMVCGLIAFAIPPETPWEMIAELMRPSLSGAGAEALAQAESLFEQARDRRLLSDARREQEHEREREILLRESKAMVGR